MALEQFNLDGQVAIVTGAGKGVGQGISRVLAEAGATVIVTFNLSDFPRSALHPFGIRAMPPDAFLEAVFNDNPARFLRGIRQHRASLKNPSKTGDQYLESLASQRLHRIARRLEAHKEKF